jgi:guanylate kinase
MGKIFYIIGKSATGKDHIYSRLMKTEDLHLKKIVLYTTRPIRSGEVSGRQYYFVEPQILEQFREDRKLIEARAYNTVHGIWNYFMADDGQVDLSEGDYLAIGTLESFTCLKKYYTEKTNDPNSVIPLYIEVETGERLTRALNREKKEEEPKYSEMCRRFLADEADFSEENIQAAGISRRFENIDLKTCTDEIIHYIKTMQ